IAVGRQRTPRWCGRAWGEIGVEPQPRVAALAQWVIGPVVRRGELCEISARTELDRGLGISEQIVDRAQTRADIGERIDRRDFPHRSRGYEPARRGVGGINAAPKVVEPHPGADG